jgi:hypothetical protein
MRPLERGYRALVRAYPPGRRRTELLDTLIEAAPADRRRPTARETVNLLGHGLRARLGRPGSRGVVVLAVLIALVTGFYGAAAVTWVAWGTAPGFPAGAALREINETVFPGLDAVGEPNGDGLFFDPMQPSVAQVVMMGHSEDFEFSYLHLAPPGGFIAGDYPAWTDAARDRLVAAGWQVSAVSPTGPTIIATGELDESGRTFEATRDGLALAISTETDVVDTPAGQFWAYAELDRLTPWWVTGAGVGGLLLGALAGWLATGWVSRRTEQASPVVRSLTREPVVVALLLLLPQSLLGLAAFGWQVSADGPPGQPFWSLALTYGFGCGWLGLLLLMLSVVVALFAGRPAPDGVAEPS